VEEEVQAVRSRVLAKEAVPPSQVLARRNPPDAVEAAAVAAVLAEAAKALPVPREVWPRRAAAP